MPKSKRKSKCEKLLDDVLDSTPQTEEDLKLFKKVYKLKPRQFIRLPETREGGKDLSVILIGHILYFKLNKKLNSCFSDVIARILARDHESIETLINRAKVQDHTKERMLRNFRHAVKEYFMEDQEERGQIQTKQDIEEACRQKLNTKVRKWLLSSRRMFIKCIIDMKLSDENYDHILSLLDKDEACKQVFRKSYRTKINLRKKEIYRAYKKRPKKRSTTGSGFLDHYEDLDNVSLTGTQYNYILRITTDHKFRKEEIQRVKDQEEKYKQAMKKRKSKRKKSIKKISTRRKKPFQYGYRRSRRRRMGRRRKFW